MSNSKDTVKIGTDVALAAITAQIAELEDVRALELQMQARRAAGETLSDDEVQAQLDKTDAALDALQKQIDAAKAARAAK